MTHLCQLWQASWEEEAEQVGFEVSFRNLFVFRLVELAVKCKRGSRTRPIPCGDTETKSYMRFGETLSAYVTSRLAQVSKRALTHSTGKTDKAFGRI